MGKERLKKPNKNFLKKKPPKDGLGGRCFDKKWRRWGTIRRRGGALDVSRGVRSREQCHRGTDEKS